MTKARTPAVLAPALDAPGAPGRAAVGGFVALLVVLTLARLAALSFSALQFHFDEAQYWAWSEDLAFGYFSKPPLIAWLIRAATELCGTSEACVRAPAPILHALTAFLLFLSGRRLYGTAAGLIAGSSYALAPAVAVSSFIISTDVPLLFFWALALYAFIRLLEGRSALFGLMLAFAIALGLNAKYAMVYFPVLALAYLVLTPAARPALRRADMLFGLLAGFLGLIPNILWNAENGFITFAHTGDNIEGGGLSFALADFFGFVASQFAIAGPIILAVALYGLWRGFAKKSEGQAFPADRMVLFLSLPILTVLTLQAGLSRANPNWAATAFPALTLYASALMLRFGWRRMIAWNAALLGGIALVVLVFSAGARSDQMIVRRTNMKHMFGWEIVAAGIERAASEAGVTTVVIDNRKIAAAMVYYLRETGLDVRAYRRDGAPPTNHFELTRPADPATLQGPFLLVAQRAIESFGLAPERLDERDPITEEETRNWRQAARLYAVTPREEPDRER